MIDHSTNINVGHEKIIDLDADEQGNFIAFTNGNTVITNDTSFIIDKKLSFPIIRKLDAGTFLIADSRTYKTPNCHIYNFNGELITSFFIGDGIQDIIICNNRIIATYFDEGVFGSDGPNNDGLAIFDLKGQQIFGFNSNERQHAIHDCYCICRHTTNTVIFYAYSSFYMYELNVDTFSLKNFITSSKFEGASALSGMGDNIIFHASYNDKASFFNWHRYHNTVAKFGNYSSSLKGIGNGKFLAFGESGFTIIDALLSYYSNDF